MGGLRLGGCLGGFNYGGYFYLRKTNEGRTVHATNAANGTNDQNGSGQVRAVATTVSAR